jgi:hypothetical protein
MLAGAVELHVEWNAGIAGAIQIRTCIHLLE